MPVAAGGARSDHQLRARHQRQEQLQPRDVERERGHRQQLVRGFDARFAPHRPQEIDHRAMLDLHALRLAGGARGVHHVRQIARLPPSVFDRRAVHRRPVFLRQHQLQTRIPPDEFQTLLRIIRVQRNVRRPGFQYPQHRDQHFERRLNRDPHQAAARHPSAPQPRRQLPGLFIQLRVGQPGILEPRRNRLGRALGLLRDQLMQAAVLGIVRRRQVPTGQRLPLDIGLHRDRRQRAVGVVGEPQQQRLEMAHPALDRGLVEQSGIVVAIELQTLGRLHHIQEQIEVHEALGALIHLSLQPLKPQIPAHPLQVELHLDQRQPAGIAGNGQLANQRSVGIALVLVGFEHFPARPG